MLQQPAGKEYISMSIISIGVILIVALIIVMKMKKKSITMKEYYQEPRVSLHTAVQN